MAASKATWGTVLGWTAGGLLGILVNFALYAALGETLPLPITTFGLFVAGAFAGMAVSDRLGERAFRTLAVATGILLALTVVGIAALLVGG